MSRLIIAVLAGCAAPAGVLANRGGTPPAPHVPGPCDVVAPPATPGEVSGIVYDLDSPDCERLAGATIVLSGGPGEDTAITDENGKFVIATSVRRTRVTIYFIDQTVVRAVHGLPRAIGIHTRATTGSLGF